MNHEERARPEMMELVLRGKLTEAAVVAVAVADARARDRGEEKENFLIPATSLPDLFFATWHLDYSDLVTTDANHRLIAATMTVEKMLGGGAACGPKLIAILGGSFPCPSLVAWLKGDPCGCMSTECVPEMDEEEEGPLDKATWVPDVYTLAYLYCHTKGSEARNESHLAHIFRHGYGVRIMAAPESNWCRMCHGQRLDFPIGDLAELPKLPRHWGCRCFYTPLL